MKRFSNIVKKELNTGREKLSFLKNERPSCVSDLKKGISFFKEKCFVHVANNPLRRKKAYRFIYEEYSKLGYIPERSDRMWYSMYDAFPKTTTLIAETDKNEMAGALTVVFDSPIGLPAENLYPEEVKELRRTRPKVCEIISFATNENVRGSVRFLAGLFYCIYLLVRKEQKASDLVITVSDRREDFYCRNLLFEKIGSMKPYDKVNGAPTILLRLDWELIDRLKVSQRIFPLSMFDHSEEEEIEIIKRLNIMTSPMTYEEYIDLFSEKSEEKRLG